MPLQRGNLVWIEIRRPVSITYCQTEFLSEASERFVSDGVKSDPADPRGSAIENTLRQALINVGHD